MSIKSRCGLHQAAPPASHTLRCMPVRRTSPNRLRTSAIQNELAELGFRVADNGAYTSKTLMLQELDGKKVAFPVEAPAKADRAAIGEDNGLGRRTLSTCKETASPLTALHGLNPPKHLFRVLRRLWDGDPAAAVSKSVRILARVVLPLARGPIGIEVWLLSPPQQTAVEWTQMGSGFIHSAGSRTLADPSQAIGSGPRRSADG